MRSFLIFTLWLSLLSSRAEDDGEIIPNYPEPDAVLEAMKKATAYYRSNLSFAGGYARGWTRDLKESKTEGQDGTAVISIQPHGTTTVGLAMVRAHAETGDPLFLQGAKEVADVLEWTQFASGGWGPEFNFELPSARKYHYRRDLEAGDTDPGKRRASTTLDDNKTQSAIKFLMEFANSPSGRDNDRLRKTLDFAWEGLLAAQTPNGAWPQHFSGPADPALPVMKASFPDEWSRTFPAVDYTGLYTLNDNNLQNIMELLLEAYRLEKVNNARFLEAATRLGDFLLLAQMPEPQPGWAQQYDFEMHPAWARKFEPPAVASIESLGAIRALIEIWLVTGDEKYIATVPAALDWFNRSKLKDEPGTWARFYEMKTNKPLYCAADTYEVTYDDTNLPTHYGFIVSDSMERNLGRVAELIANKREDVLAKRERDSGIKDTEKDWSKNAEELASKARSALKYQKKEGYWVDGELIDAGEYVKHMMALTNYLSATKKGGATYESVLEKERKRIEELKAKAKVKAEAEAKAAAEAASKKAAEDK